MSEGQAYLVYGLVFRADEEAIDHLGHLLDLPDVRAEYVEKVARSTQATFNLAGLEAALVDNVQAVGLAQALDRLIQRTAPALYQLDPKNVKVWQGIFDEAAKAVAKALTPLGAG